MPAWPAGSEYCTAAATAGESASFLVSLRPYKFSEALMIGISECFSLFIIVQWCTVKGQFIPDSQHSGGLA